jgi:uncharacterized phage protein gp47/JayE
MPYDETGYTAETLPDILTEMSEDAVASFGPDTDTSENSVLGILLGLVAIQIHQQSQHVQEMYSNRDADNAEGKALDDICYETGIIRKNATYSTVTLTFTNDTLSLESIPSGTEVTNSDGNKFITQEDLNVPASGTADVSATAEDPGPVQAEADSLTQYSPSITDVTVTNNLSANVGSPVESDTELRLRRDRFLSAGGNCTLNAIATQVSNISGVTSLIVVENDSNEFEDRGEGNEPRPPKSFEVVAEGGSDEDIATVIAACKPIGIQSFGDTVIPVQDNQGIDRAASFTRPVLIDLYVKVNYTVYEEEIFPVNGELTIKNALESFAEAEYTLGKDVIPQRLEAHIHKSVPGLKTVLVQTSLDDVSFNDNIRTLQVFEKANLTSANISFIN